MLLPLLYGGECGRYARRRRLRTRCQRETLYIKMSNNAALRARNGQVVHGTQQQWNRTNWNGIGLYHGIARYRQASCANVAWRLSRPLLYADAHVACRVRRSPPRHRFTTRSPHIRYYHAIIIDHWQVIHVAVTMISILVILDMSLDVGHISGVLSPTLFIRYTIVTRDGLMVVMALTC